MAVSLLCMLLNGATRVASQDRVALLDHSLIRVGYSKFLLREVRSLPGSRAQVSVAACSRASAVQDSAPFDGNAHVCTNVKLCCCMCVAYTVSCFAHQVIFQKHNHMEAPI